MNKYLNLEEELKVGNALMVIEQLGGDRPDGLPEKCRGDENHAYYLLGCAYYSIGRYGAARRAFLSALRRWRWDFDCLLAIGNCCSELKMCITAGRYFRRGMLYCPDKRMRGTFSHNLGNALFDQGRYQEAIRAYCLALRYDRSIESARKNKNLALKRMNAVQGESR